MTRMPFSTAALAAACLLGTLLAVSSPAQADEERSARQDRGAQQRSPDTRGAADRRGADQRAPERRFDPRSDSRGDSRFEGRHDGRRDTRPDPRWWDGAHGHNRHYQPPGRVVVLPPRPPAPVLWGGVSYRFWDGMWVTSGSRGWVTVRPPLGIVVHELPSWRTTLTIGGLPYYYLNGSYYRPLGDSGYEVVAAPVAQADTSGTGGAERVFIYPRHDQGAERQASDEYECHRWATQQSGFDPTGAATGQGTVVSTHGRSDYRRAQAACLEGRGYTVR
ncbi:DUF6515 family protein [Pseudorhodoferax sp.]|uniref:DUF6515 family protein n=1 Tax=Pseudorhodoferax sp. TaxID=1993553 RepID=UPI002DD64243|nr:DUF6515 family protein [Pseudorhodoferax sp.]